jgi:hypothetical protein
MDNIIKIIENDESKKWFLNGKLHREDGPAIEYPDGSEEWYLNNKLHREDGPAIDHSDGTKKWYLNDREVTEEEVMGRKENEVELALAVLNLLREKINEYNNIIDQAKERM